MSNWFGDCECDTDDSLLCHADPSGCECDCDCTECDDLE